MREIGRSGAVRCTASPVPFARAAGARQHRPGAAAVARAFLARQAAVGGRAPGPRERSARLSQPSVEGGAGRAAPRPVRLTRRGRVVVLGLVLLLGALVGFLVASPGQAADPPKPAVTAVVQPGDTLWSFAERNVPRWHTIDAVAEIQRLNHLEGSVIHPGQRLVLPARR
jgi:hypothetical protein